MHAPPGSEAAADAASSLLVAMAAGDRDAVRSLYDLLAAKLLGLAYRILHDRQEAEDVVQDVFVTLWRKAAEYDPALAQAESWVITITRNRCIDRIRARGTRQMVPEAVLDSLADPAASASAPAEQADTASQVHQALAMLEPRHADVIRSAYLDGLSYDELARREGVPTGTIKTWVFRGLRRMREQVPQ